MSLSPLAARIYQTLVQRLRLPNPLITYSDLVGALGPLPPPNAGLMPHDQRLNDAFAEIIRACQHHNPPLPLLTSIVVQRAGAGTLGIPGSGYFAQAFPHIRQQAAKVQAWQAEVKCVKACSYPQSLSPPPQSVAKLQDGSRLFRQPTVIAAIITAVIGVAGTLLAALIPLLFTGARDTPAPLSKPDPVAVQKITPPTEKPAAAPAPVPPAPAEPPQPKRGPDPLTLESVLDVLERHHQRATFGAVAGVLGREPRSLFDGYARTPRTAWVVSKSTGLPTGTRKADYPAGLLDNDEVINSPEALRRWMEDRR